MTYTDDPIDGSDQAPDLLERGRFANAVAAGLDAYRTQKSSSVIALVGPWGAGKSSLISLVRGVLQKQGVADGRSWSVVSFNPWLFQDLASLQIAFLGALQGALGGSKRSARRRAVRSAVGSFGKRIAPLGGLGVAVGVDLAEPMKGIAALIEGQEDPERDQVKLTELLLKEKSPVLVVMDDLDRLSPDELLLVFKLVRLVGRLPYVHYLIAYDEDTLLDVLSRTGLVGERDSRRASDYLEKMIQLRLDVPPLRETQISSLVDEAINAMAASVGLQVDDRDSVRFSMAYSAHLRHRLDTPRAIKRYVAQVEALFAGLGDEVDPVDFLLLTWLRTAEPLLYTRLPAEKVDLVGASDLFDAFRHGEMKPSERREHWVGVFEQARVAERHRDGVAEVLGTLFPRFRAIWNSQNQFGSGAGRARLIANRDYFDRYFAFDVPKEDISDSQAAAAYAAILEGRMSDELLAFTIAFRSHAQLGVNKLEQLFEQRDTADSAEHLILWLARELSSLPENHDFLSPRRIAANFCARLYLQLPSEEAVLNRVLDSLATVEGGMLLGARLISAASEHPFSGSAHDVAARTDTYPKASNHFASMIKTTFDRYAGVGAFDLPAEVWPLIWTWRSADPAGARMWVAKRVADGSWTRIDLAARLVTTHTPSGIADPEWRISELDMGAIEELIGVDALIEEIGPDVIRSSTPSNDLRGVVATQDTRRVYVIEMLRRRLLKLEENSA